MEEARKMPVIIRKARWAGWVAWVAVSELGSKMTMIPSSMVLVLLMVGEELEAEKNIKTKYCSVVWASLPITVRVDSGVEEGVGEVAYWVGVERNRSRGGWGGIMSIELLPCRVRLGGLRGKLGGTGLEFEEEGGRVEMHQFTLPSLSVFLLIQLGWLLTPLYGEQMHKVPTTRALQTSDHKFLLTMSVTV
jgi:hypothetical protein